MPKIRDAAIDLYRARIERVEASKALKSYREQHGSCEREDHYGNVRPCYYRIPDQDEWCEVCLGSQPLFERKMKASQKCGAAIRRIMHVCKKGGE